METSTLKMIKGLKQREGSNLWTVTRILADEYGEKQPYYNLTDIEYALRETIVDYFNYCDDPRSEVQRLLYEIISDSVPTINTFSRFLTDIRVKKDDKWINGFDDRYAATPVFPLEEGTNNE